MNIGDLIEFARALAVTAMYLKTTFYRYRGDFIKLGIDIVIRQPSKPENVILRVRVLRPEAIAQVPKWAVGISLYFDPKKRYNK